MDGNVRDNCFKFIGYPDCFKNKTTIGRKPVKQERERNIGRKLMAATKNLEFEEDSPLNVTHDGAKIDEIGTALSNFQQEFSRLVKGKADLIATTIGASTQSLNCGPHAFADNFCSINTWINKVHNNVIWILDTGATDYISPNNFLFNNLSKLQKMYVCSLA